MAQQDGLEIKVDDKPILFGLQGLAQDMQKTVLNEMAGSVADTLVLEYIESLQSNANRITGEGLQSIESLKQGTGRYSIFMKAYLEEVDKGTTPAERKPVEIDERLVEAANFYGMNPVQLRNVLQANGTKAHPFKEAARQETREQVPGIVAEKFKEAVEKNFNTK